MAAKKGGLGKGLEALFAENAVDENESAIQLKINEIEPNRQQPRKEFDESALMELADSIAQHGILQPLLVRPVIGNGYQLVAGERRWRAARMAGLTEVPVIIRQMSDQEMMELALIENLQREDLNAWEEAEGFRQLMDSYQMTQEEVAKVVGKSRPAIANSLRILGVPASVAEMIKDGILTAGHARALLAFPENEIEAAAKEAAEKGLSVRELEKLSKNRAQLSEKGEQQSSPKRRNIFFDEVEIALTEHMGRKVKVTGSKNKGKIEISFYNQEELKEIAKKLAGDME